MFLKQALTRNAFKSSAIRTRYSLGLCGGMLHCFNGLEMFPVARAGSLWAATCLTLHKTGRIGSEVGLRVGLRVGFFVQ